MHDYQEVVIIGSGPSGISLALRLRTLGIEVLMLERSNHVAGNWRHRIPDQYMTTPFSVLRLRRGDRRKRWITGSEYWSYLQTVVEEANLNVQLGWEVTSIKRGNENWQVTGPCGSISCSILVIATGQHDKRRSSIKTDGTIRIVHSSDFSTQHLLPNSLVVGLGISGADIATALAKRCGSTSIALRTIPVVLPRTVFGIPVTSLGDFAHLFPESFIDIVGEKISQLAFGELPWESAWARHRLSERKRYQYAPVIDSGFVEQVKRGHIHLKPALTEIVRGSAIFQDGESIQPSVVIDATGYEANYQSLFEDEDQRNHESGERRRLAPLSFKQGIFTVGLRQHLNVFASFLRTDSDSVATQIARQLKK